MLIAVMGCTLIGGLLSALVASLFATFLVNWFFVPPVGSFSINERENVVALLLFVIVGCTIAVIAERSTTLATEARQRRAEAEALTELSTGVLRGRATW